MFSLYEAVQIVWDGSCAGTGRSVFSTHVVCGWFRLIPAAVAKKTDGDTWAYKNIFTSFAPQGSMKSVRANYKYFAPTAQVKVFRQVNRGILFRIAISELTLRYLLHNGIIFAP